MSIELNQRLRRTRKIEKIIDQKMYKIDEEIGASLSR